MRSKRWSLFVAVSLIATSAVAQTPATLSAEDRAAIQELMGSYARALGGCQPEAFADLFVPDTGSFASGFRGVMVGRDRLVKLVQSERHCIAPAPAPAPGAAPAAGAARPGGANGPTTVLEVTPSGVRGVASLGTAEYQDEYVKTAAGWRFASRTVLIAPEKAAGLDAREVLAIERLAASKAVDRYEPDANGVQRLMTSGVRLGVKDGAVTGRVFLKDGSYDDEVYEKVGAGNWRVKSSVHVPVPAK